MAEDSRTIIAHYVAVVNALKPFALADTRKAIDEVMRHKRHPTGPSHLMNLTKAEMSSEFVAWVDGLEWRRSEVEEWASRAAGLSYEHARFNAVLSKLLYIVEGHKHNRLMRRMRRSS